MYIKYAITLTLIREMLGTNPADPAVMDVHVLQKQKKLIKEESKKKARKGSAYTDAPDLTDQRAEKELELLKAEWDGLDSRGTTVFFKDPVTGRPMIGDHMIYGFMKAAGEAICQTKERASGTMLQSTAFTHSIINRHVRCEDEFIVFDRDIEKSPEGKVLYAQRSLRAKTMQGDRVALARSEVVPRGAKLSFVLKVMDGSPLKVEHLNEIFGYGEMVGLGQWRSSGKGSFTYEMEEI